MITLELIDRARRGNPRAIARLITQVENSAADAQTIIRAIYPATGRAHIVGITGPPGSGKSSLVNELVRNIRRRDQQVSIVAVDPSSPFTGGALLGDRVRMRELSGDEGVFVRSMASRGNLGGLARSTSAVVKVLDAAGFDVILIETVGAGQAEVDIAATAHTTVVLEAPGMGDDVQSIKAGILEIADILVVNKADQPGAGRTIQSLQMMLQLGQTVGEVFEKHHGEVEPAVAAGNGLISQKTGESWRVPLLQTVATTGQGVPELVEAIISHRQHLTTTGGWQARERARSRREIEQHLQERFMTQVGSLVPADVLTSLILAAAERRVDPFTAADELFERASMGKSRTATQ